MPDPARFSFNRAGTRSGPHTAEEMLALAREGVVTSERWVLREGDTKWTPLSAHPELAEALAAATTPAEDGRAQPAQGAQDAVAVAPAVATTSPSRLEKVTGYTPGQRLFETPLHVAFAHPPAEAAQRLREALTAGGGERAVRSRTRTLACVGLAGAAVLAVTADLATRFGRWDFSSVLLPLALIGIPMALVAVHSEGAAAAGSVWARLRSKGIPFLLLIVVLSCVGSPLLLAVFGVGVTKGFGWILLSPVAAFIVLCAFWLWEPGDGVSIFERERHQKAFDACASVVEALAEDVAPNKPVTGWADFTGAEHLGKLTATGTAASGARIDLYRDEWFHLAAVLRDGNRIRVAAVVRKKMKRSRTVSRTRGYKTKTKVKPGSEQEVATLEVRVRVNPAVYRTRPDEPADPAAPPAEGPRLTVTADTVSAVVAHPGLDSVSAGPFLQLIAAAYRRLEPLSAAGAAPPTPGATP